MAVATALWLITLAMALAAFAAEPPATPDYRLGPDDAVSVTVLRHPELSAASLLVTADGQPGRASATSRANRSSCVSRRVTRRAVPLSTNTTAGRVTPL